MKAARTVLLAAGAVLGVVLAIAAGIAWCMAVPIAGFAFVEEEGSRVGQVVKFSERGVVWKTWEGQLAVTQNGAVVDNWSFSVDSANPGSVTLVRALQAAAESGWMVRIVYEGRLGLPWPWRADTCSLVRGVEFLRQRPWPPAIPRAGLR